ncbi:MAG: hypothetical protein CSA65_05875 [Proteobacteria bacterium]|nr:MAG: hypothetical protein CSA65_05875 [Pseudomonadota bacterium]
MIDKIKATAMQQGMKLLSNPRVMKLMADPRFMNVLMKGLQLKGKLQSDFEERVRSLAATLNLATKDEVTTLEQTLRQVEHKYANLEAKVAESEEDDQAQA